MNLVLLGNAQTRSLAAGTPAAVHIAQTLKLARGETFWCGVKNGARGLATIREIAPDGAILFSVEWEKSPPPALPPIALLVGLSRPQTMKKVFALASELGCARIDVFRSEKGDPAYAQSAIWKNSDRTLDEILEKSAAQTAVPAVPAFALHASLADFLKICGNEACGNEFRFALDVYENAQAFAAVPAFPQNARVRLAIGSERGWTDSERAALRAAGFSFAHLGARVLRTETAVAAALAIAFSKLPAALAPHVPLSFPKKI